MPSSPSSPSFTSSATTSAASPLPHKSLLDLGWPHLVEALAARCHTTRGAAAARAIAPLELAAAQARIAEIAEARALHASNAAPPFGGIEDIHEALDRAERAGTLAPEQLVAVGRTTAGQARLRRHLHSWVDLCPRLFAHADPIQELSHVSGPLADSFDEAGRLVDHASAALGPLRRKLAGLHEDLKRRVRQLIEGPELADVLQDTFYTQREDRYVVPIRADAHRRVKGIVHGTSGSGATIFVEPEEIVDLNNRLKLCEGEVHDEEERILTQLTAYVREEAPAIRAGLLIATRLDLIDGAARLADTLDASAPVLAPGAPLRLARARHPLMVLAGTACVPNDLTLAPGQSLIISGPNAGGKTVALKTVGLCCLLARHGLHVPCDAETGLPFVRTVLTDMGDDQSIERNLSTFSAHITHLCEFFAEADADTLILIDEIAAGTDPEQGAALAQAVLEGLATRGARVLVTTHYERLKTMAPRDDRFVNASVGFDLATLTPTFELHVGLPGSSGALSVARRLGLDGAVCARAEELLGSAGRDIEALLASVEAERKRLADATAEFERTQVAASAARHEAEAQARLAVERARAAKKGAHDEAVHALRAARAELDAAQKDLRRSKAPDAAAIAAAEARVDRAARQIMSRAPDPPAPRGRPPRDGELVAGLAVVVARLGDGILLGPPERGKLAVRIGTMRSTVDVADVRVLDDRARQANADRAAPPPRPPRSPGAPPDPASEAAESTYARTVDGTLDLRGERVDAAFDRIDKFIDDSLLASREVICLLHGHGTGALRAAVREHCNAHPMVAKLRPGTPPEGGDGVTLVWLG